MRSIFIIFVIITSVLATSLPYDPCEKPCPELYHPACGQSDAGYKTFLNICFIERERDCHKTSNWTFLSDGECDEKLITKQ